MNQNLPEAIREDKEQVESIFLRTILKKETYSRLQQFAKSYSTGQGHWDFGVAIQVLLDEHDNNRKLMNEDKLNYIISLLNVEEEPQEQPKEEEFIEMLGGHKISKN